MEFEIKEYFCGIDASLSGTGLIVIDRSNKIIKEDLISTIHKKDDYQDIEKRILFILKMLESLLEYKDHLKMVLIEGISFGSKGDGAAQLAALNYAIRIWLYTNGFTYSDVSPSSLKKFVSGKGNCKKNLMLKEVYKKWNVDFNDDNICDAYSLARFAKDNYIKK